MTTALTQKVFARRLRMVMDEVLRLHGKGKDIAEQAGIRPNTLSRWRNENYESGPPRQSDLRNLEPVLRLPKGALLSTSEKWRRHLKKLKNNTASISKSHSTLADATSLGSGKRHPSPREEATLLMRAEADRHEFDAQQLRRAADALEAEDHHGQGGDNEASGNP